MKSREDGTSEQKKARLSAVETAQSVGLAVSAADSFQEDGGDAKCLGELVTRRCDVLQGIQRVIVLHHLWEAPICLSRIDLRICTPRLISAISITARCSSACMLQRMLGPPPPAAGSGMSVAALPAGDDQQSSQPLRLT